MRLALPVILALLSGCASEGLLAVPVYERGQEFTLAVGKSALVGGRWLIEFTSVPEDSRCPMNARCIWEGNARVAFQIRDTDQPPATWKTNPPESVELNTSERFDTKKLLTTDVVTLRHLEPSRMAGVPITDYVATLVIEAGK